MHLAALKPCSRRGEVEEAGFAAEQGLGLLQRGVAVEFFQSVRGRVIQLAQGFDAAIGALALRIDLSEMSNPVAAFADGLGVADGQCQQGFQLADTQFFPE